MPRKSIAGTAADPTIEFVDLKIGDENYRLAWDFNSIVQAEAASGLNLMLMALSLEGISASQLRAVFYASLLLDKPEMTLTDAGEIMAPQNLVSITKAIREAWKKAWPEDDPKAAKKNAEAPGPKI